MDILNPGNLNYWQQILKNKEDIESLKKNSNMFTYVVGHATSIDNMPFDSDNIKINKNDFRGYIINRVINDDNPNYTLNVTYNTHNYETDLFIFFGTEKGLYLICFPVYNNESILYLGKWNGITYEYCNQITQDLADSIQELAETLSNYQNKGVINTTSVSPITLADNTSFRLGEITTLTINNATSYPLDFMCEIVFKSGTGFSMDYSALTITFSGDDCDGGVFTPTDAKTYNILFFNNSNNDTASLQAIVRGV